MVDDERPMCLRCGKRRAISKLQPLCFDCLVKTRPKIKIDPARYMVEVRKDV